MPKKKAERAIEPDAIEAPGPRSGENGSLAVLASDDYQIVKADFANARKTIDDLARRVNEEILTFGELPEIEDEADYSFAKKTRASVRSALAVIGGERKKEKAEYLKPLNDFEEYVKRATDPLEAAERDIKAKMDAYERGFGAKRRAVLKQRYEEDVEGFADLVPFDVFLDKRGERGARGDLVWLRRSCDEYKALTAMEEELSHLTDDWRAIEKQAATPEEADRIRSYFTQTLDFGEAIRRNAEDREREEAIRAQREAEEQWRREQAVLAAAEAALKPEEPEVEANTQAPLETSPAQNPEPQVESSRIARKEDEVCGWHIVVDVHIRATRTGAQKIADTLKSVGLKGYIAKED